MFHWNDSLLSKVLHTLTTSLWVSYPALPHSDALVRVGVVTLRLSMFSFTMPRIGAFSSVGPFVNEEPTF